MITLHSSFGWFEATPLASICKIDARLSTLTGRDDIMHCDPKPFFESIQPQDYEDEAVVDVLFVVRYRLGAYTSEREQLRAARRILTDVDENSYAFTSNGERLQTCIDALDDEIERIERETAAAEAAMQRLEAQYTERFL